MRYLVIFEHCSIERKNSLTMKAYDEYRNKTNFIVDDIEVFFKELENELSEMGKSYRACKPIVVTMTDLLQRVRFIRTSAGWMYRCYTINE